MNTPTRVCLAGLLAVMAQVSTGCKSLHSHVNRPLTEGQSLPDCRATAEIQQSRGEEDVLVILCLSGGGSRASWFSAATMLRLESVVDEINLLHEVDVISSASGGSLPAAYYCVTRDPGPYSVVRVEQLPESLPVELLKTIKLDRQRGLLGARGKLTPEQRDRLLPLFTSTHDQACVEHLFWLSHHTRAPAVWQPQEVRELMTHDYIAELLSKSFSPLNVMDDFRYWFTSYDRSDQMAEVFVRHMFGTKVVQVPTAVRDIAELEFLGWLDRPPVTTITEHEEDELRWPKVETVQAPLRLDWIPGYSLAAHGAQFIAGDVVAGGVEHVTRRVRPFLPYRFKDLNPERPYLILNTTDATENYHEEKHFGELFPFIREEFKRQLDSDIDSYPVAWGVMASAAFPGVFSYVTLRDFRGAETNTTPRYVHVFDGGNSDNLGLISAKRVILANRDKYRHFVVLLVDSHVTARGARSDKPDVGNGVVDPNFVSTFSTLLDTVRRQEVEEFQSGVLDDLVLGDKLTFWQIKFDDVRDAKLRDRANQISTNFKIKPADVKVIDECVNDLVRADNPKLQEFLRVLHVSPKTGQPSAVAVSTSTPVTGN